MPLDGAASLAECQASATGPVPIGIAIHIVLEIARPVTAAQEQAQRAGGTAHHGLSPASILIGRDGTISLLPGRSAADRGDASYRSPEQVRGETLDRRADVFSLGVVLWELLAGERLFVGETVAAISKGILEGTVRDVRARNADVPAMVGEVLGAGLARDRQARFDNVAAFGAALAGARAATGITQATAGDVARWMSERVARLPVASTAPASPSSQQSAAPVDTVPDLDMPSKANVPVTALGPVRSVPAEPPSVRSAAAAAFADISLPTPPTKSIAIQTSDDDDFDMQIERNISTSVPGATSSRPSIPGDRSSSPHAARPSTPGQVSSGLELGAPQRQSARTVRIARVEEAGTLAKVAGFLTSMLLLAGVAALLFHSFHRAGGRPITGFLPHAFDGTSANESGAVALLSIVASVSVIFIGLRLKPHAWWIILSGGALLLLALAMVTVTLASTGDNPTPPDGVLLVPYIAPIAVLLLALGIGGRAGRVLAHARGVSKLGGVPLAALGGALAFAAFEISRLAT